jgi:hypothetical protein
MSVNPATVPEYELENVQNIDPDYANILLDDAHGTELVSCTPVPGAETMPPTKVNFAPCMTVRVYELDDQRDEAYVLVTCLRRGGDGPGGILIDRAVVFDGEPLEMLDHIIRAFDEGDWSRGIKRIDDIRADGDHQYLAEFLTEVSTVLESESESRYAMDLWEDYMGGDDSSDAKSTSWPTAQ